jgi:macrolide transport system ATP-binding/permease protein
MADSLVELHMVSREFRSGDQTIVALNDINLTIESGEMVAIVGASGSGKSTLLNIIGCLDRPTRGTYSVAGRKTCDLNPDALADLRREHFGFVFQRYHLLGDLTALGNVEMPAIYAGAERHTRHARALALLSRLGLSDRIEHKPSQLSGGQQQRVSIARALMNGGNVILADEPTGALDRQSGQEMMRLLKELHQEGHTIIIVTHDMMVAEYAQRIIEISDGQIIADRPTVQTAIPAMLKAPLKTRPHAWQVHWDRFAEAFRMALLAMDAHRLRTLLTMLGIIIGIASVVSVVALGEGSQRRILQDISSIGTNTLNIYPGKDFGDEKAQSIQTLVPGDADALAQQTYIDSVTPVVASNATLRYRNISANAMITGIGTQYFQVHGITMAQGTIFDKSSLRRQAQEAVIDENTRKKLFGGACSPVGEVIFLGKVPCRVIGVARPKESGMGNDENLRIWIPYTTAMNRILGQSYLKCITVRLSDFVAQDAAEQSIVKLLTQRHRIKDVYVFNTSNIRKTIESATSTMRLLTGMIALISLIVGGIGVMNIMLVSVTERTGEIGVRMAVGARRSDIMKQFLIEAVLVCLLAGCLGILAAFAFGAIFAKVSSNFSMVFSTISIAAAFACSTLIGIVFGFLPARNAATLDPVEALAHE